MPRIWILSAMILFSCNSLAKEIDTNAVKMADAPEWVKRTRVEKVIDRIQMHLEWQIRKVQVTWYSSRSEFEKFHGLGPTVRAVSKRQDNSIHLGPRIVDANFDQIFGHELVHVIFFQKYKDAIPKWLEEGFANYISKNGQVNYKWLASKPFPADVKQLTHPFKGDEEGIHYHYIASQALVEMIAAKCSLPDLLRLSVERKLENYLASYCEIKDINQSFQSWVKKKAG